MPRPVRVSIIVPACNNAGDLHDCLAALNASTHPNFEIIVVDDASVTDEPRLVGTRMHASVLRLSRNSGPSSARNLGARDATGEILFFVDADVVVGPDAVSRVVQFFAQHPDAAAVFGSYDDQPRASGLVSQYRNLLHHYVHQHGAVEASTFWSACGAIRRSVFETVGGFDEKRFPRCIEDIELGYRLRRLGHRILLDKGLQGKHLKRWTVRSMVRTDVCCRAIPWTRLILETGSAPDDLNLRAGQRASVAAAGIAVMSALLTAWRGEAAFVCAAALLTVLALNRSLYAFFLRHRGARFAAGAFLLHLLYYLYGGLTYVYVWCDCRLSNGQRTLTLSQGIKPVATASSGREAASL
jgi:glycosyltransferase involved in cell wall biosynthesis